MKQIHQIQLDILSKLIFTPEISYMDLKPEPEMENNQFDYHLDTLIAAEMIRKEGKFYMLTATGKSYVSSIGTETNQVQKSAKVSAWIGCVQEGKGGKEVLIYTRKKQPFYNCQGLPSGKVGFGEQIQEAASRELLEETGLTGVGELVLVKHYRILDKEKKTLEDKIMFLFRFLNPTGELKPDVKEGEYKWIPVSQVDKEVVNYFEDKAAFDHQIEILLNFNGQIKFEETDALADKF